MPMIAPNVGKPYLLKWLAGIDNPDPPNWSVRLFQNDITPTAATTLADLVEATFGGYAEITLSSTGWSAPVVVGDVAQTDHTPAPQWTATGVSAQFVYGWYIYDSSQGELIFIERFSAPRNMVAGAQLTLDPFRVKLATLAGA